MNPDRAKERGRKPKKAAEQNVRRLSNFHPRALDDLQFWIQTDPRTAGRLLRLIKETLRDPFDGIGKPEPLRREGGVWSRRLTDEHRLTYRVKPDSIEFLQARYHYEVR